VGHLEGLSKIIKTYLLTHWISDEKTVKIGDILNAHFVHSPVASTGFHNAWWIACATNQREVLRFIDGVTEMKAKFPHGQSFDMLKERSPFKNFSFVDIKSRFSALHIACARGCFEMVEYLLNKGIDPSIAGQRKATPIHVASQRGYIEIVKLLLDHKASVDARTSTGVEVCR